MGREVGPTEFTRDDRRRYREKLRGNLDVLGHMLDAGSFESRRNIVGLELELNLCDGNGAPKMVNAEVLDLIASADYQTELGQFNIEVNVAPHKLVGTVFRELEEEIRTSLNYAERRANEVDAHIVMIGILPTLTATHMRTETLSRNPRYALINEQVLAARGEDLHLSIAGVEKLATSVDSIVPEAACTSTQLHLQVSPAAFGSVWNAAQAIAGVQLALGANSPFLFGRELWAETRTILFEQATDTRSEELIAQGVRPRVWFGERWIDSALDLFEENVRYFPALLPVVDDEDPREVLARGDVPHLRELGLHNGTVYRWNRPIYDVARGKPHLRVENRVLPAGPTVADVLANAAFYYGLVRALSRQTPPVWHKLSFTAAADNFLACARDGIDAHVYWPGAGTVPVTELVLRTLLPLAAEGLDGWKVDPAERDRLLSVIEQRCLAHANGAAWQSRWFHHLCDHEDLDRGEALHAMVARYAEHMHSNEPVHTWPLP
ncbi:MAG: glutamate--cysteine ligase [Actinomycetes bacterium]